MVSKASPQDFPGILPERVVICTPSAQRSLQPSLRVVGVVGSQRLRKLQTANQRSILLAPNCDGRLLVRSRMGRWERSISELPSLKHVLS